MHKQQGWPQAWEYCQAKPIQTLGRASQEVNWSWSQCIMSHHAQTSSGKELPNHFWTRNIVRSILPALKRQRTGLLLSGPKSSYISFVNQGLEEDWRGTESKLLEVQCKVSEVSDELGCRDVCWCWSIVFYQVQSQLSIYQEILELFMLPSADKLYGDADFLFQQDFSTCPHCQTHFKWSADHDISVLDWLCLTWTPSGIYGIFSGERWETVDTTIQTSWIVPQQCHRLIVSIYSSLMLEFVLKEPRPSTECRNDHTFKNLNFSVLQILF